MGCNYLSLPLIPSSATRTSPHTWTCEEICPGTIVSRNTAVQYNIILHKLQKKSMVKLRPDLELKTDIHTSPLRASFGCLSCVIVANVTARYRDGTVPVKLYTNMVASLPAVQLSMSPLQTLSRQVRLHVTSEPSHPTSVISPLRVAQPWSGWGRSAQPWSTSKIIGYTINIVEVWREVNYSAHMPVIAFRIDFIFLGVTLDVLKSSAQTEYMEDKSQPLYLRLNPLRQDG